MPADPDDRNSGHLLNVDHAALVPLFTKAMQDLAAQVADLQAQPVAQPIPQSS